MGVEGGVKAGVDVLGTDVVGADVLGADVRRDVVAGADVVGADVLGADVAPGSLAQLANLAGVFGQAPGQHTYTRFLPH